MSSQPTEVVVVGGGQAGLALSFCLTEQGRPHIVLEQDRIVESWRSNRWDSLRLIAPNWSLRLPGFTYAGDDPDGFMSKDEVVTHLETYAESFTAPVREGVRVTAIERGPADPHFLVRTQGDSYRATQVVLATGALQQPRVPDCAKRLLANVTQVAAPAYRNPRSLPPSSLSVAERPAARLPRSWPARDGRSFLRAGAVGGCHVATGGGTSRPGSGCWAGSSARSMSSRLGSVPVNPMRN